MASWVVPALASWPWSCRCPRLSVAWRYRVGGVAIDLGRVQRTPFRMNDTVGVAEGRVTSHLCGYRGPIPHALGR
jgi:hypothetical protein